MAHSIKTVYVVHHSHTDIGYTDLQERVIAIQVNYIKTVLSMMRQPEYADFRWNCETLYCVEEFWKQASEEDRADFARFVKEGKIGISANYLNFNDLVNADVFGKRLAKWQDKLQPFGTKIHTAMAADVNGFSMGYRDAMIENGVEFFFTNVHCHHGMYPLYQNQNAFFWENASGQRLLVWNGEHYNLGNVLGLQPNHAVNWMMRNRLGEDADAGTSFSDQLHTNLDKYLTECETEGYSYDFIVTAVSGVFSDNAPPSAEIMETIRAYNEKYGQEVRVEMVSLQELYAAIAPKLTDAPVYRGDWTDWWANGVGSTPYAVKNYKDADHRWQLANRLDPDAEARYPALSETVQDNLMLYALAVIQQAHLVRGHKVAPGLLVVDAVTAAAPLALVVTGGGDGFFAQQFRNIFVGFFLGAAKIEKLVAQTDQRFPIVFIYGFKLRHVLHNNRTENGTGTHGG